MSNRIIAGILAIFLGSFGIHKFYMGNTFAGIIYLLFCWTSIPGILGIIEGIVILLEDDDRYEARVAAKKFLL